MKKVLLSTLLLCLVASGYAQTSADSLGIWAVQNGKAVRMDRLNSQGLKTTGGLASQWSLGIAKEKMKAEFRDETSPISFDGTAKFLLYFGEVPETKKDAYGIFGEGYSIRDFEIGKFIVKKGKRQLVTGTVSLWTGTSLKKKSAKDVETNVTPLGDGVYELEVTAEPGEYCIYSTVKSDSGLGVYDFTIK